MRGNCSVCGGRVEDSDERTQDARTKKYLHLACALDLPPTVSDTEDGNDDDADDDDGDDAGLSSSQPPPNPPAMLPGVGGTAAPSPDRRPNTSGAHPSANAGAALFGGIASLDAGDGGDGGDSISLGSSDTDTEDEDELSSSSDSDSDDSDGEIEYDANGNIVKHGNRPVYVNGKLIE